MKKTIIAFFCMMAGLLSCTNDDNITEEQTPAGVPMTFNISVDEGATTRAAKTAWANGDKIYVFFNGLETKYLIMEYDGSSWSNTSGGGTLLDTDFSGLGTKTLTAVHFPVAVDVAYADSRFSFTSGGKRVYNYYLCDNGKSYTVSGTTVTATLAMGKPADMVQIHVAGIQDNVTDYTFGCTKIKPVACASVVTDGTIVESVLQAGARLSGIADSDGGIFAGRLTSPDVVASYIFTVASDTHIYTLTRLSRTLTAGKMYTFPSLSTTGGSNWAVQNASDLYVDLGLSVKWAKCNVGAYNETSHGVYFAWGEIMGFDEGKTNFAWSTYVWGTATNALTKYVNDNTGGVYISGSKRFRDDITTLLPEDDAAYAALGGKFRMPTSAEIDALIATKDNTSDYTWTWCDGETNKYQESNTKGWKIVKNSSSATIFLPAVSYRDGESLASEPNQGNYWTSSLLTSDPADAKSLVISSSKPTNNYNPRYLGFSIRPVYAE